MGVSELDLTTGGVNGRKGAEFDQRWNRRLSDTELDLKIREIGAGKRVGFDDLWNQSVKGNWPDLTIGGICE